MCVCVLNNYQSCLDLRPDQPQSSPPTSAIKHHQKRQIYREQVLPHAGGKIPDSAFETHRLALNRLQKEGIAIPDGVLLEQRSPQVHQYTDRSQRPTYRVRQTSDERYTPPEGRYPANGPAQAVDTTYSLPQITQHSVVRPPDPMQPAALRAGPQMMRAIGVPQTGEMAYALPPMSPLGVAGPLDPVEPVLQRIELPNGLLRGGPQKVRAKYEGPVGQAAELEPAKDQYYRHAGQPYHQNCQKSMYTFQP